MTEHILNRLFIVPFRKARDVRAVQKAAREGSEKEMTIDDMRIKFPSLVRGCEFVQAMEIIQGHDRFNWFYALFDKISRGLFGTK